MKYNILYLLIPAFLSCSFQKKKIEEIQLSHNLVLSELSDSISFVDIRSIIVTEDLLYLVDYEINHLLSMDIEGSLKSAVGRAGHGPGEFLGAGQFFLFNDTIFVFSAGKNAMEIFLDTNYIETMHFNNMHGRYGGGRFCADSDNIYMPLANKESNISVISMGSKVVVDTFGKIQPFKTERQTIFQNSLNGVFSHENEILAVFSSLPKVERYSKRGELKEVFSLMNVSILQEQLQFSQNQLHIENLTVNLVTDSYLKDDLLYILLNHREGESIFSNRVLVLDVSNSRIELSYILNLGEGWYRCIGVSNDYLWAFCARQGSMLRFPL